jgi:hypothetical protein
MTDRDTERDISGVEEKGYRPVGEGYRPAKPSSNPAPRPPTSSGGASKKK